MEVGQLLESLQREKPVFAESCTGGMAAALMTQVPGISKFFCGSAVTYREPTKTNWLKVSRDLLQVHSAESQATSDAMAIQVLEQTPEATISVAITGHLGPDVDEQKDGRVFVSLARRSGQGGVTKSEPAVLHATSRIDRQLEAAELMLTLLKTELSNSDERMT